MVLPNADMMFGSVIIVVLDTATRIDEMVSGARRSAGIGAGLKWAYMMFLHSLIRFLK